MTIAELIAALQLMPLDLPVWGIDANMDDPTESPVETIRRAPAHAVGTSWERPERVVIEGDIRLL